MLVGSSLGHRRESPVVRQPGRLAAVRGPVPSGVAPTVSANRPTTVSVFPTSMASSMSALRAGTRRQIESQIEGGGRVGEGPDRDEVGTGHRQRGALSRVTPPDTSTSNPAACTPGTQAATSSGAMLSSMITVAPAATASATCSTRSHSTSTMRPGQSLRALSTASAMVVPARWLSLIMTASERLPRWL